MLPLSSLKFQASRIHPFGLQHWTARDFDCAQAMDRLSVQTVPAFCGPGYALPGPRPSHRLDAAAHFGLAFAQAEEIDGINDQQVGCDGRRHRGIAWLAR